MSARCRCECECERLDPELDVASSSWLVCMPCDLGRHRREIRMMEVNIATLERLLEGTASERERRSLSSRLFARAEAMR
ncbi:hypothetical protein UFOVP1028_20 [uncultured Caudovirales phage]|uniref:Uncharacterized protein n=1 Tax=uncultured Caudovirales phage TaxID=2100421 RepID=A0A6J5PY98_9CAUD|nr:hypothetical protein UFOVP960_31 [uncultured Caudovirales phage]CAB4178943.1 hypothetical protein UFOVP1028_20 [uncultured Caudovirales phage]CAB4189462.1 hypothetical protein UFOVP1187_45 [uncultured Caudovirales phage]CAB4192196.1 hypothetical protein UFOVP1235_16 [uncultured Caudovirales phage]CAB4215979.1 hypothetical protein UFOVP1488_45 [uncultured Caudovirales phage]